MLKPFLIFCCLFFLFSINDFADTGCIGTVTGNLYLTPSSGTNYDYTQSTKITNGNYNNYCIFSRGTSGSCIITNVPPPYNSTADGYLVDFSTYPCPIDNYNWVLFIVFSCSGFFVLRKNCNSVNTTYSIVHDENYRL